MSNQSKFKTGLRWFILLVIAVMLGSAIFGLINWAKSSNGGICETSNYKVVVDLPSGTNPPTATNLNRTDPGWCTDFPTYFFTWTYSDPDGDTESRFDFQIDTNSGFSDPIEPVNRSLTGLSNPSGTENNQYALIETSPVSDKLIYNQTYYWRVKVYDSGGADSGFVNGGSFTTALHHYPDADFSWSPESPLAKEEVQFFDKTTYYGGSAGSVWSWTFTDGDPSTSGDENPITIFQSLGGKEVILTVTDSDGFSCDADDTVTVGFSLPKWKEIIPW